MNRLLIIIFAAFVCLGMPHSILGAAWPAMYADIQTSRSFLGVVSLILNAATFLAIVRSDSFVHKYTIWNVLLTAFLISSTALLALSMAHSAFWIIAPSLFLGIGRGTIDASVNSYAALHYKTRYINWLHCFWGAGSMLGPILIGYFINAGGWGNGYLTIALIQYVFVIILVFSRGLWEKAETGTDVKIERPSITIWRALGRPNAAFGASAFFCYVGYEMTAGLWASSFLSSAKGMSNASAAGWAAFLYGGITLGRFVSGLLTKYFTSRHMIRYGCIISLFGVLLMALPLPAAFS
ncbi:MAG: MFS transporter, partial [Clostridiales bacterium]|nr:MFS transporter [Clostridiales bacterium]